MRRDFRRLIAALGLVFAGGVATPGAVAATVLAEAAAQSVSRDNTPSLGAPDLAAAAPVSLSLQDAVTRALASDEALAEARQQVAAATAGVAEARSQRLPRLDLTGRYARNLLLPSFFVNVDGEIQELQIGADNEVQAAATATLNLWTAGRISSAAAAAREGVAAAEHRVEATASDVRFLVKEAYLGSLLAQEQVEIAQASLDQAQEALRVTRASFEQGTASRYDLMRAEVELTNRRLPLVEANNQLEQILAALRRRVGMPPETPVALTDSLAAAAPPLSVAPFVAYARTGSPLVEALRRQVAARRQLVSLARAERWPSLQLSGNYALQGQWNQGSLPPDEQVAGSSAVALGFSFPVFDGLQTRARVDRAQADLRTAELQLEAAVREIDLAVRQAWLSVLNAQAALEGRREAVELAEETYRLAVVRIENGLATPLERLDAELALTTARAQFAAALHASNLTVAALELAVGRPLAAVTPDLTGDPDDRDLDPAGGRGPEGEPR
ncbi:MAG: TolC family protein [Candidatus Krumholzibacteriia bacterium]